MLRSFCSIAVMLCSLACMGSVHVSSDEPPHLTAEMHDFSQLSPRCLDGVHCNGRYAYEDDGFWYYYYFALPNTYLPGTIGAYAGYNSELPAGGSWYRSSTPPIEEEIENDEKIVIYTTTTNMVPFTPDEIDTIPTEVLPVPSEVENETEAASQPSVSVDEEEPISSITEEEE